MSRTKARFLQELRRRQVFRVAVAYTLVGWLIVQVAETIFPALAIPRWILSLVVMLIILGFPIAVALAWAFEITPDGVKRTEDLPAEPASRGATAPRARGAFPRRTAAGPPSRPHGWEPPAEGRGEPAEPPGPDQLRRASLATLRHELRTPLNAVLGYSEMLLEDAGEARADELRRLNGAGQRLLTRVDALLRPDGTSAAMSDGDLEAILARVRGELSPPTRELAAESRRVLEQFRGAGAAELLPDVQHIVDAADRLVNLVESPPSAGGDFGPGAIPASETRRVAEQVIVPRRASTASDAPPPRHGHLLVVDDNALNLDLLSRQLARQGFSISVAADGSEALEVLRSHDFDLVLLDVLMPGIDGIQVLERMQRDRTLAEIPVIMMSALDEIESVVRCIERGAVDYLTKPFDPVLLQARIGAALELHRLRAQQRHAAEDLRMEVAWSERLARSLVPEGLVERLRDGKASTAEMHPSATVLAMSLQGMGTFAARHGPTRLAEWMDETISGVERIVSGRPVELYWEGSATLLLSSGTLRPVADAAVVLAEVALELRDEVAGRLEGAEPLRLGMGLHQGPAVTALIEAERLLYGLWGEAGEVAREIARQCPSGEIHVSPAAYAALYASHTLQARGVIETSDRSQMRVHHLVAPREGMVTREELRASMPAP